MKSISILLGILLLCSFAICDEVIKPIPSDSNLDHFEILNKSLNINKENTLTLKTYDSNNNLINIDSFDISLENGTISGKEFLTKDTGVYEISFFLPNNEIQNITYDFEVVKDNKVLRQEKTFKISKVNINFDFTNILDQINDWSSNNEDKTTLYLFIGFIGIIFLTIIVLFSKK